MIDKHHVLFLIRSHMPFSTAIHKIKTDFSTLLDFQSRIWVVHIFEDSISDQSFVINEDDFKEPLEWMRKRDYHSKMLDRVDKMKISQVFEIQF